MPKKKNNAYFQLISLLCGVIINSIFALSMQFVVIMPSVITQNSVTQFDIFGTGIGAPVFIVTLSNIGDTNVYNDLFLIYQVDYVPKEGVNSEEKIIYKGKSRSFSLDSNEYVPPISSKEFLKIENYSVKTSIRTTMTTINDNDPLKVKFINTQRIPDGRVRYTMTLLRSNDAVDQQSKELLILNSSKVELVAPGSAPSNFIPDVYESNPVFTWTSDLPPNIYENSDVFEIRIYRAFKGEEAFEAMSRLPVVKGGVKTYTFKYPTGGPQLIPGVTYYWEVVGFLKSHTTTKIKSTPYVFKMARTGNPDVLEVINILKQYPKEYTKDIIDDISEYDSDVIVKVNNLTIGIEELRTLINDFKSQKHSVISTDLTNPRKKE